MNLNFNFTESSGLYANCRSGGICSTLGEAAEWDAAATAHGWTFDDGDEDFTSCVDSFAELNTVAS